MFNKDVYMPYYSGNINFTKVQGVISLETFIRKHYKPKEKISRYFDLINDAEKRKDKAKKRELKQNLVSFTPSVMIKTGNKRNYNNVEYYTGLMQLDFDGIETVDIAYDLKKYLFNETRYIITAYLSPSGLGVKALLNIDKAENKDDYKAIHKAITAEYGGISYFDDSTKNAMLPLFLSRDVDILYRDISKCETWTTRDFSQPNYVNLKESKPSTNFKNNAYYERITGEIFQRKIQSISDNGHPQLRSACLILGSRVGADYMDYSDALYLAEDEVKANSYFHKDIGNYISTAKWAINQGLKNPKYY